MLLDSEDIFLKRLIDMLPSSISIIKSSYRYCRIDFLVINKINIKTLYIEHKLRSIIGRNYPSVWIKKDKIESILKDYGAFLFVSECKDDIYYIWIDDKTIDKYVVETNLYGEVVVNILTADFSKGYDGITKLINDKL